MAKRYRLSPLAENDLERIWLYTLEHWSQAQADGYYRDLVAAFEALALGRKRGRATTLRPGYLKYPCGAHVIYFRQGSDRLDIIRILHGKQDADRHL
ncbi:type II toxin-antitoxin system RelE/ParE family toxin [Paracoccus lichenicola]|nr:type II toxin-antitoxin system RelE/ParE family toxin [Paracoccus lichenicola]